MMADRLLHLLVVFGIFTLLIGAGASQTPTVNVTEGDTARLECRSTVRSLVDWKKQLDPRAPGTYIVVGGRLIHKYKPRFEFDNDTYALTIHNVTGNNSGLYYCIEDKGAGQQHFVRLNVELIECASSPCLNGGTCIEGVKKYACSCPAGYIGVNCQTDVDECGSSPCENNGTCSDGANRYTCKCAGGFTGVNCQTSVPTSVRSGERNDSTPSENTASSSDLKTWLVVLGVVMCVVILVVIVIVIYKVRRKTRTETAVGSEPSTRDEETTEDVCRPYCCPPQLVVELGTESSVIGVTQMDRTMFVVCWESDTIRVFGLNYKQLEGIKVEGLKAPVDIVACTETRLLYVADWGSAGCVWRVSMDGQASKFLPITTTSSYSPRSLSVTSRRLLVTTADDVLSLYGADGVELKRLPFTDISEIYHAVETSRGTFAFCHLKPQPQVVEVDADGQTISFYDDQQQLTSPWHLSLDSEGKIYIADKRRILLLTSDLHFDRVLLDTEHHQLVRKPWRLFYVQDTRQLIVGSEWSHVVQVFAIG